jgi:P pilus assembly chaperone PapD
MRLLKLLPVFLLATLCALPAQMAHAFGIGLQPTTVEMQIEPGERQRQVITIVNVHKEKPIALTLGLADWSLDENGQIMLAAPGDMERSASDWVRFSPAFVDLKPGESQQVVVDMVAPTRIAASGDHRFALIASTILPDERASEPGVWKKYQLASLFYLNVGPSESRPVVLSGELVEFPSERTEVVLKLGNDGDAHARLEGEVEVKTADGRSLGTAPVSNFVVLDRAERFLSLNFPAVVPADAMIEVRLENTFVPQNESGVMTLEPVVLADLPRRARAAPAVE